MEENVTSDGENPEDFDMNGGGNTKAQQQPDRDSTSSEAEVMIIKQPSGRSQSVDETKQAPSPSDGEAYLNDMMKPASDDAGFVVDKTAASGVYDHNDHFQMNASAPPFHAPNTALDADYTTQFEMAESLEAVNQNPFFLAAGDE